MCTVLVGCHGSPHPGRSGLTILALGCATHAARATAPPRAQGKAAVRPCGPVEAAELARSRDSSRDTEATGGRLYRYRYRYRHRDPYATRTP